MRISKIGKRWQVRWREGTRQRARNFRTKELAQEFCRELDRGAAVDLARITFGEFAEQWKERHASITKAERTLSVAWDSVQRYLVPAFGHVRLDRLDAGHLLTLRAKLRATPVRGGRTMAPKTVNNILVTAREIVRAAVDEGILGRNPWTVVSNLPVPQQAFDFWTVDERERFLRFCRTRDPELAELVLVACHTGLRKGELRALTRAQLDFTTSRIRVDATYDEHLGRRLERSKNKKVAFVPMTGEVRETLLTRSIAPGNVPVFRAEIFADIYDRLRRRCREAGVREIGPHDLRHTFASILVMAGVPIYTVSQYLRHSSVSMTERYAHLAPEYLGDAIEMVSARNVHSRGFGENKIKQTSGLLAIPAGLEPVPSKDKKAARTPE